MNETQKGDESCENANGVKENSSPRDGSKDSVQVNAPLPGQQENEDKLESLNTLARDAEKSSINTQGINEYIAQENAQTMPNEQLAQIVKSAGSLCEKCTTAFVQSLVLMLQERDPVLHPGQVSTLEHKRLTLIHNLVLNAANQEDIDITQIIQSQKLLSGFVSFVIESYTENKKLEQNLSWSRDVANKLVQETPFRYVSKSSRGERDAGCQDLPVGDPQRWNKGGEWTNDTTPARNTHSCVKPVSLIKWLATLCRPPAQFKPRIAIPYCGSGSEVIGAILAGGWAEIHGIDNVQEYLDIAAARIAWWTKWAKLTTKTDPAEIRKLAEAAEKRTAPQGDEHQTNLFDELGLE